MVNLISDIQQTRVHSPERIGERLAQRMRRPLIGADGRLFIIAADHPARGALTVRDKPHAMANRHDLIQRLVVALENPHVDGVLGTPDILEDLALLGALDNKLVVGSLNRSGLAGANFAIDDRVTGYQLPSLATSQLDMTKLLLRMDLQNSATPAMLEQAALAVTHSAQAQVPIMLEPFMCTTDNGEPRNLLDTASVIKSIAIATALGNTSAYSWLKIPVVPKMEQVMAATTLPTLLLGGDVDGTTDEILGSWQHALSLPGVRGLVVGRSLLYPNNDDVARAVATGAALVHS